MNSQHLKIHHLVTGAYNVNTYIIFCDETRQGAIIDPGGSIEKIIRIIEEQRITPRYIINTHGHHDHTQGNNALASHFGIPVCMHVEDIHFFHTREKTDADLELHHNTTLDMGSMTLQILHTPGHTPGSVCIYTEGTLFSGDTLFVGDAGRTDIPGGNIDTLIQSIKEQILPLPHDTRIYPGHDYGETPFSTLAREIKENIYITDFITDSDG